MNKYALFLGCNIPARVPQYEKAARAVLDRLGIELVDFRRFKCCGYPIQNVDREAYVLSAAGNLAVAEEAGLDMLVLCKCCYGSLRKARYLIERDEKLRQIVDRSLQGRGLRYSGRYEVKHFLSVLYHDVGLDAVRAGITRRFQDLRIAAQYGCHALRPSEITRFDDPIRPRILDELVEATGAVSVDWPMKLECCGAPLLGVNDQVSLELTRKKAADGKRAGAHYLCTACPYCHQQFDSVGRASDLSDGEGQTLSPILYPQLLGLSMGLGEAAVGLETGPNGGSNLLSFLST